MLGGIRRIPPRVKRLSMPLWAGIFYSLLPGARRAIESNLDHVCGPPSGPAGSLSTELERHQRSFRLFCNYAQMLSDTYGMHMGLPLDSDTGTNVAACAVSGSPARAGAFLRRHGRGAEPFGAGVREALS